jgi:hypothetical protein
VKALLIGAEGERIFIAFRSPRVRMGFLTEWNCPGPQLRNHKTLY